MIRAGRTPSPTKKFTHRSAEYADTITGDLTGKPRSTSIEFFRAIVQAEAGQFDRVGPKRIRLDRFCTCPDVAVVDFSNEIRLGHREFVITHVDEHAMLIDQCAHRAIEHMDVSVVDQPTKVAVHQSAASSGS